VAPATDVEILLIVLFEILFTCAAALVTLIPVIAPVLAAVVLIALAVEALPITLGCADPSNVA